MNLEMSSPADDSTCHTAVTSLCQDSGSPDWSRKSGPSVEGRHARYAKRAATRDNVSLVLFKWIVTTSPKDISLAALQSDVQYCQVCMAIKHDVP